MKRKEFIKRGGRVLILSGFAAAGSWLILNNKVTAECKYDDSCKDCRRLSACKLPEALKYRAKEVKNGRK